MNTLTLNNASLDGGVIIKRGGVSNGISNVLTSWEDYNESTMGGYALSASLGHELHNELNGLDSLLDEVNGASIEMINEINGEII